MKNFRISSMLTHRQRVVQAIQEKEIYESIQILGRYNRYIVGPSHDMTPDIPMKNFDAMINSIQKYNTLNGQK